MLQYILRRVRLPPNRGRAGARPSINRFHCPSGLSLGPDGSGLSPFGDGFGLPSSPFGNTAGGVRSGLTARPAAVSTRASASIVIVKSAEPSITRSAGTTLVVELTKLLVLLRPASSKTC